MSRRAAPTLHAWLAVILLASSAAFAQAPPPTAASVFSAETGVVLLDVVVRDKKGRAVRDLGAGEVEVYEDGVRQAVTSFRIVERARPHIEGPATEPTPSPAAPAPDPGQVSLCTLLFDQLGPEGRAIAR